MNSDTPDISTNLLESLKLYVDFSEQDILNLRALADAAQDLVPHVVDRFYEVLFQHAEARSVFTGGEAQIVRQKKVLAQWIRGLFAGDYGRSYVESRLRIGEAHVRVGLAQRLMPLAIEIVRVELACGFRALSIPNLEDKLSSLNKLLTIDLTIMLESYKESYSTQIRDFERKAVEAELAQAQHLAEIGQLAASLAHEIKNPLAGISGAIQVIGDSLEADSTYRPIVRDILAQIGRLDATVKDLLLYARPTPPDRRRVNISELVPRLIGVLRTEPALKNVDVRYEGVDAVAYVDERQFEQLLMNLILNAAHASSDGATIHVDAIERGNRVALIVQDFGSGMPPEVKERALEPFFTTKAKGTGLGLAICCRIVASHHGTILIDSKPGEGTTVCVELPRYSAELEEEPS